MLRKEAQARYERTEKGIATRRRYRSSLKGRMRRAASARRYYSRHREKVLARAHIHDMSIKEERAAKDKARLGRGKAISFWVNQAREAM